MARSTGYVTDRLKWYPALYTDMTFTNTPHLVVVREANPDDGTNLHEFWVLKKYSWHDGVESPEDPPLKVHISPWNGTRDTARDGLPPADKRTTGSCSWSEAPKEVREEFRQEANRIQAAAATMDVIADEPDED